MKDSLDMMSDYYTETNISPRRLLEQLLYEAYTKPQLKWIDDFAYDLNLFNQEEANMSDLEYTQALKDIENKYNMEIHLYYPKNWQFDEDIRKSVMGYYDIINKVFFLKVTPNFFSYFEDYNSKDYIRMKKFLAIICSHENTHQQQFKDVPEDIKKSILQKYERSRLPDGRINPAYFNQKFEIDAFARGIAEGLLNYYDKEEIKKKLTDGSFSDLNSFRKLQRDDRLLFNRLQTYANIRNVYPDIWKKFLREVLDYLEIEDEQAVET